MSDSPFDPESRTALLNQALEYAVDYLSTINERSVAPSADALVGLSKFDEPLPTIGSDPSATLDMLHEFGSPATVAQIGGRYFGFVNGGIYPPALAARWLADAWDQNSALYVMSPVASRIEEVCERWLVDLFRLPLDTAVGFVSGTSMSLMCGIAAARHSLLARSGWDVVGQGLFGAPQIRVVLGEQAHGTVFKALSFLGLGRDRVEKVSCDSQGRINPESLPQLDANSLLILSAGNVNSGAFDDMKTLIAVAREAGAWTHVDGAFGLWAAASPATAHLYDGAEYADSWSVDAHKTLNVPYDCGAIFCRDRHALVSALQATGSYIQWSENRDGMMTTPEMSRRARVIELWMVMKTLGRSGIAQLVEQLCARAKQFADELHRHGFEIVNTVVFNQVLVACSSDSDTTRTLEEIQRSGVCWCSGSSWQNRQVIRISVCSCSTTETDVLRSVETFILARDTVTKRHATSD